MNAIQKLFEKLIKPKVDEVTRKVTVEFKRVAKQVERRIDRIREELPERVNKLVALLARLLLLKFITECYWPWLKRLLRDLLKELRKDSAPKPRSGPAEPVRDPAAQIKDLAFSNEMLAGMVTELDAPAMGLESTLAIHQFVGVVRGRVKKLSVELKASVARVTERRVEAGEPPLKGAELRIAAVRESEGFAEEIGRMSNDIADLDDALAEFEPPKGLGRAYWTGVMETLDVGHGILSLGSRGVEVTRLQRFLKRHGYEPGPVDGIFGPQTKAAVKRFQADEGLVQDGAVGPATMFAIRRRREQARAA